MAATTSAATTATATPRFGRRFFEGLWRSAGIQGVAFLVVGAIVAGFGPASDASADAVAAFYTANAPRLLIATPILALGVLNLVWFMQAIRVALAAVGLDGWGAAGTAASAMMGGTLFIVIAIQAVLAYAVAGDGNTAVTAGLNNLLVAVFVLSSLPRAMFVMAPSFGFWRAGYISNTQFVLAVGLVILGVLGATTWIAGTVWAPDAAFSRVILPTLELVWVVAIGRVLSRVPSPDFGF